MGIARVWARRAACLAGILILAQAAPAAAQATRRAPLPDPLAEARRLYNSGHFDAAIEAAHALQDSPSARPGALLVLGRSSLERYRQTSDAADLARGREALRNVDPSRLSDRDRLELVVGLGQALYLDEGYEAAAEVFDSVVQRARELGPTARDQVLDWWATALDRHAQQKTLVDSSPIYDRIIAQMTDELRLDPGSTAASYWMAAAARAKGDLDRAWDAAMAGWVRAQIAPDGGATLRPDLDKLMLQGIIPDRARRLPGPPADLDQVIATMAADWETFKEKWGGKH